MDEIKDKLHKLKEDQKNLLSKYESLVTEYDSVDVINENSELKREVDDKKKRLKDLEKKYSKAISENQHLRVSLQEQILDEKLNILKISQQKLNTYFQDQSNSSQNKLVAFEKKTKQQILQMQNRASKQLDEDKTILLEQLEHVELVLQEKIRIQREQLKHEELSLSSHITSQTEELASDEVSEEMLKKRMKQNQIEMKIGLNWLNKIGIILILFGVAAASKYTYSTWFNDYLKGISFFILGALLLAGGEWSYRKIKNVFATGLLGGGISVLYGAVFYSYFQLNIINMNVGILLSIMITLTAIVLSLRYHSKTICSLGLIGGYLPLFSFIFAFGLEGNSFYAAMVYLLLLNASIVFISFWKSWSIVHYISFFLHVPSIFYLAYHAPSETISILYTLLAFLMYLVVTLAYPFKYKIALLKMDVAFLGLNTLFSCFILYFLFDKAGLNDYRGLLALAFSLVYVGLGQLIHKVMRNEKYTMILFYSTSLTFAVLMIPFQFGVQWLALGWLIEGIILVIYGFKNRIKSMELAGWGIFLLCIGVFYFFDAFQIHQLYATAVPFFDFKYFAVMLGMVLVTLFYLIEQKKTQHGTSLFVRDKINYFKYFTMINLWFYFLYTSWKIYDHWIQYNFYHFDFYKLILTAFITIGLAYTLKKVTLLYDKVVGYFSLFLYVIGYLICLVITVSMPLLRPDYVDNSYLDYFALFILISYNLFVLISVRELLIGVIKEKYKNIEWAPAILSLYLLGLITAFLIVQFRLGDVNLLFSFIYLLLAISYILYGFRKKYTLVRRIGLGLAILSTTKLFIYDLSFLDTGSKIIAYFCFGVILLGISFIYQKISNKMGDHDIVEKM